ncbi:hypothetical protein Fcan01_27432 [Folsomia candida]|uniref:DNA-directed DNA polymerase n=1 Tax=Folsomia candida TaxID=158441 RepID=A0A226CYC3_FOLCA|nr:hypothetical protein Fcan01_27432 [Folsomia candida]
MALSVGMNSSATSDLTATYDSAFESLGHDGGSRHSQNSVRSRPPGHIGHLSKEKANGICLSAFLNEENEVFSPHTVFYEFSRYISMYHKKGLSHASDFIAATWIPGRVFVILVVNSTLFIARIVPKFIVQTDCNHHHSEKCMFCSESHCPSKCALILADFEDSPSPVAPTPSLARKQPRLDYKTGASEPLFFNQEGEGLDNRLRLSNTILNTVRVYTLDTSNHTYTDVANVFRLIVRKLQSIVQAELDEHKCVKIATEMHAHFHRPYLAADVVDFEDIEREQSDLMKHTKPDPVFHAYPHTILQSHFIPEIINSIAFKLIEAVNDFIHKGSGWILDFISKLQFSISPFAPFSAGAYIPNNNLLQYKDKSVLLNIDNRGVDGQDDFRCFIWSCLAHEQVCGFKKKWGANSYRYDENVKEYKKVLLDKKLNFDGLVFPMTLSQLPKFEEQNPGIALSVFGYEEGDVARSEYFKYRDKPLSALTRLQQKAVHRAIRSSTFPLYMSRRIAEFELKNRIAKSSESVRESNLIEIDLLLVIEETEDGNNSHFNLIRKLSSFLRTGTQYKHPCRNCLNSFTTLESAMDHREFCYQMKLQKTDVPEEPFYFFNQYHRMVRTPYRYYADFEAFVKRKTRKRNAKGLEVEESDHNPCGYAWVCVDWEGKAVKWSVYRTDDEEEDVAKRFFDDILEDQKLRQDIIELLQKQSSKSMIIDPRLRDSLKKQIREDPTQLDPCYFCGEKFKRLSQEEMSWDFKDRPNMAVFHHDHCSGKFLGLAHNKCNLEASIGKISPCFIHNLKSYDSHFLVQAFDESMEATIIPCSSEKFMSFTVKNQIRFCDSFSFLSSSLENLTNTLKKNNTDDFKLTKEIFGKAENILKLYNRGETDEEWIEELAKLDTINVDLLLQKAAYPYTYMQSPANFEETQLPPIKEFYNDLNDQPLDQKVYDHATQVWESFNVQNLGDWHNLYVLLDVTLLADCMERSREILWDSYNLDLAHYFSLPMIAYDACCKMGKAKLDYVDVTMHCWFETALRGGVCGVGGIRAAEANNKYMGEKYDETKTSSYISFLDINNLYGSAMCSALPEKDYKWLTEYELDRVRANPNDFINSLQDDDETGYFFEVDLEILPDTHNKLNDYPPAPTKRCVSKDELAPHQLQQMQDLQIPESIFKNTKLVADLHPKKHYVTHYRNLKMYIKLGLVITQVHHAVKFTQMAWIKPFILFKTEMRKKAVTDFEKDFFKLLNNASFGKTIEQKRKRTSISVVTTEKQLKKIVNKPTYERIITINDKVHLGVKKVTQVLLDKPVAVGISILEISKCFMYEFHYDYMKEKYGDKARVLYGDTDSLVYHVETEDFYQDMVENKERFDLSDYAGMHSRLNNQENKKRLGKMKDEMPKSVIYRFAASKPKMYGAQALSIEDGKMTIHTKKVAKGIKKAAITNQITFDQYWKVLDENIQTSVVIKSILSRKHVLRTSSAIKKGLNGFDTKRCVIDHLTTLAHGHKDIPLYI